MGGQSLHPEGVTGSDPDCAGFRGQMAKKLKVQNRHPDTAGGTNILILNIIAEGFGNS